MENDQTRISENEQSPPHRVHLPSFIVEQDVGFWRCNQASHVCNAYFAGCRSETRSAPLNWCEDKGKLRKGSARAQGTACAWDTQTISMSFSESRKETLWQRIFILPVCPKSSRP